jgi:hypothetical protein
MTLIGGEGTSAFRDTCGDTIYEDFGPFYIRSCVKGFWKGGAMGISIVCHKLEDFISNGVELGLSSGVMCCQY